MCKGCVPRMVLSTKGKTVKRGRSKEVRSSRCSCNWAPMQERHWEGDIRGKEWQEAETNQVATWRRACLAERRRANRQDCALRVCEPHGGSGLGADEGVQGWWYGRAGDRKGTVIRCHRASSNQQNFLQVRWKAYVNAAHSGSL